MAGIDLHAHTNYSDGTFAPPEAVALAADRGLDVLAVTDHDTTEGLAEAFEAGTGLGVEIVPGIEFSTIYRGDGVHILCYYMDPGAPELSAELERLQGDRFDRGERMVAKLQELGYPVSFERVREIAKGGNVIRPHVAGDVRGRYSGTVGYRGLVPVAAMPSLPDPTRASS